MSDDTATPPSEAQPQGGLFPEDDQETLDAARAVRAATIYNAGNKTQREGGSREDNPHAAGSEDYTTWDVGWLECAEETAKTGAAAPTASTTRKPRKTAAGETVN